MVFYDNILLLKNIIITITCTKHYCVRVCACVCMCVHVCVCVRARERVCVITRLCCSI